MNTPKQITITKISDTEWKLEVLHDVEWSEDEITVYTVPSLDFAISILAIYN